MSDPLTAIGFGALVLCIILVLGWIAGKVARMLWGPDQDDPDQDLR